MRPSQLSLAALILALAAGRAPAQEDELPPKPPAGTAHPGRGRRPAVPDAPLLHPYHLDALENDGLERPGHRTALYALGKDARDYHPEREPLLLVHGFKGEVATFGPLLARLAGSDRYQVYMVAFDDYRRRTTLNAEDF